MTIDPDVAAEIERIRVRDGRRFKQVLNDALRAGLLQLSNEPSGVDHSPTTPVDLGTALVDVTNVSTALAAAEGEDFR
ncbi:hypothetical protein [Lacisediminihabitans sp.]|uniref:hypothetical protein n=1 Tax=Lacisediminihabitans sp. TaxID=2787631 RepID=UPI002F932FF3